MTVIKWNYTSLLQKETAAIYLEWFKKGVTIWEVPLLKRRSILLGDILLTSKGGMRDHYRVHEGAHRKRQREVGVWLWYLKYTFSRKFRMREECFAYFWEMTWRCLHNGLHPALMVPIYTRILSGWVYLWAMSKREANKEVIEMRWAIQNSTSKYQRHR